jgi:predicted NAD-dependent protein-ADP-ribosyltransferase YbiA (DUF1768 family)
VDRLKAIPHWRRVLSNFYPSPIQLWDYTFPTAEHAFQAAKFRGYWPATIAKFAYGRDPATGNLTPPEIGATGLNARNGRKLHILDPAQLEVWNSRSRAIMATIRCAKFTQDAHCLMVLKATGTTKLIHIRPRQTPLHDVDLERLRVELA